jgi:hypothetical protein
MIRALETTPIIYRIKVDYEIIILNMYYSGEEVVNTLKSKVADGTFNKYIQQTAKNSNIPGLMTASSNATDLTIIFLSRSPSASPTTGSVNAPTTTTTTTTGGGGRGGGLSIGVIAGIVIAIVVIFAGGFSYYYFYYIKRKADPKIVKFGENQNSNPNRTMDIKDFVNPIFKMVIIINIIIKNIIIIVIIIMKIIMII